MKKCLYFYLIAIVMMTNDALFNWIGSMVGIPFWRQMIWLVGFIILFKIISNKKYQLLDVKKIYKKYITYAVFVFYLALFTFILEGFNIVRIVMSFFEYFFGVVFVVFPFICVRSGWNNRKLYKFFIVLGSLISTGLLLDFSLGGAITSFFKIINTQSVDESQFEYYGRFSFLSTTDSIFTLTLCLSLFCCFREYPETGNSFSKIILLILSVYIIFCSIFTGARQTLAGLLIVEFFGFFNILRSNRKGLVFLVSLATLIFLSLPLVKNILSSNIGFENRYNITALQEDERGNTWKKGVRACFIDTNLKRLLIGSGVGYTSWSYAAPNEARSGHYENTFLARIIDVGIPLTIALLLTPVFFVIKYRRRNKYIFLYSGVIFSYLFISLISPNGLTNQSQMILFILLGMFFNEDNLLQSKCIKKIKYQSL